jgi:hypothetical protein
MVSPPSTTANPPFSPSTQIYLPLENRVVVEADVGEFQASLVYRQVPGQPELPRETLDLKKQTNKKTK